MIPPHMQMALASLISIVIFLFAPLTEASPSRQAAVLASRTQNLDPKIVQLALSAHQEAKSQGLVSRPILTVIDYSKKSIEKRLWVFDLSRNKLIFETYVTHGVKSGQTQATRFSNVDGSLQTSLGVFTTGETYHGSHGYSLRMDGLEKGINHNARKRAIVIHGANYATENYIKRKGTLGLSWGCPAVDPSISRRLIDTIKNGSLIFAYYPDRRWLNNSSFLN
jgi:hypothetical protein